MTRRLIPILLFAFMIIFLSSANRKDGEVLKSPAVKKSPTASEVASAIEILDRQTPLSLVYNEEVAEYIDLFLNERRGDLELALLRSSYYFPLIEEALLRYELPLELKYVPVIESGLNPQARSKSGAVGIWQFLYNTCALFDLQVNSYIDERRDVYLSTDAACRYFRYLYNTYHDWDLVMAGYNGGPGEVRKAIARSGGETDYWKIRDYMTEQARNYVPAITAINYLMNNYKAYGIQLAETKWNFQDTDTLHINYGVSFGQISSVLGISVETLAELNPVYIRNVIPDLQKPCILVLPADVIEAYLTRETDILGYKTEKLTYHTLLANAGSTINRRQLTHTVQPGEFCHKIAISYDCTIENLRAWNDLESLTLYPGQELQIWVDE